MVGQVDLVLPGLFDLPAGELDADLCQSRLPALNSLLRFAGRESNSFFEIDSMLADCLGLDASRMLPFASAFVGEKGAEQGSYMLCRAVHLKADMRNAFAVPLDEMKETKKDIDILINDLNELFEQDCIINEIGYGVWLMYLKSCQPPSHYPLFLSIVGRKVDQYIEQSRAALPWYQLMNEIQMFLHSHEVNQKRLQDGRLPINSLWCWGAGEYIQPKSAHTLWYCDEPGLEAYAERSDIEHQAVSAVADTELIDNSLIVDLSLLSALKSSDDQDLSRLLVKLEQQLFQPLLRQVRANQIKLRLRLGHDNDLFISAASRYRFWKRPTNLIDWLT